MLVGEANGRGRRALLLIGAAGAALLLASFAYAGPSLVARARTSAQAPAPAALAGAGLQVVNSQVAWLPLFQAAGGQPFQVFKTTDGGQRWQRVLTVSADQPITWMSFFDARRGLVLAGTRGNPRTASQLYSTADGGAHWRTNPLPIETGLVDGPVAQTLSFADLDHGWYLAGLGNEAAALYRTLDGGRSWAEVARVDEAHPLSHGLELHGRKFGIRFASAREGWIGIQEPGPPAVYHSPDGGQTWRLGQLPERPLVPGEVRTQLAIEPPKVFGSDAVLMVSGAESYALASADGGESWSEPRPLPGARCCPAVLDASNWWELDGATLYSTSDGGRHWESMSPLLPAGTRLNSVIPASRAEFWGVGSQLGSLGTAVLLRSRDGGRSWTAVSLPRL